MVGQIAAFIAVGPQRAAGCKAAVGEEELQELQGDAVGERPAILGALGADGEVLLHVPGHQLGAGTFGGAEAQADAAVGVDLQIEVPILTQGGEEELHAAVLADLLEITGVLSADMLLPCLLADVEILRVIAQLLGHAHTTVRQPQDIVHL